MFKKTLLIFSLVLLIIVSDVIEARKLSRSRSSSTGRGSSSSKKTNPQPAPTSFSYPQASAPKPSLFGWQEKPAQKTQISSSQQAKPSNQAHSYPSSNTGLSGNSPPKQPPPYQESFQRSNVPSQQSSPNTQKNNQPSHSYPASNSLSGNSGNGAGYPQGNGLSGSQSSNYHVNPSHGNPTNNFGNTYRNQQSAPPPYTNVANNNYQHNQGPPPPYTNVGNMNYHHPQGPPPSYSNYGHGYGGYGGSYNPQSPGYFGGYSNNNKNYGGMSRSGSALTGVGIAGAGIGTVLTGLALWNLARSTGRHHHTVIYDNRGQPVAVAPDNNTEPVVDPFLSDLVNCTLTISNGNNTEILAIPCSIATSFSPEAEVKETGLNNESNDNTKCTITVVTKSAKEYMTTIPCSILLNTAAENNVTDPAIVDTSSNLGNETLLASKDILATNETLNVDQPTASRLYTLNENGNESKTTVNCSQASGDVQDPNKNCFNVNHNLTVIPLETTEKK